MTPYDALRDLLQRYARAIDSWDADALVKLFHPEAVFARDAGDQTLDEFLEMVRSRPASAPSTMHVIADPIIVLNDRQDEGTIDAYAMMYQRGDGQSDEGDVTAGINYIAEVVLYKDRWVFKHRETKILWKR